MGNINRSYEQLYVQKNNVQERIEINCTLRWLVGMTKSNQIRSLVSILNVADLKVGARSILKKNHTTKN